MNNADRRTLLWLAFLISVAAIPIMGITYAREHHWSYLFGAIVAGLNSVFAIYQLRNP